ncbi:MAG: hypothetical protein U5K51_15555 [Flavobacteriaceae bacterium]|nr:hypothetical protein [Flavobacteriaceae bacterium]
MRILPTTEIRAFLKTELFLKGNLKLPNQEYNQAKLDVTNAQNDYQIIKMGSTSSSGMANTNIRATVPGTVLEIPVKVG